MLIFVACLVIFVYGMLSSLLGTIIPGLADQLHLTNSVIGYIALAQGIGLAGTSVFAGALMDRKGTKLGVSVGLVATIAGLGLLTQSANAFSIAISMAVLGFGGSSVIVGANAIANEAGGERRAAALNFLNVFSGLGGLVTPFVAGNLLGANPRRTAVAGLLATILVLVVALLTPISKKHLPPDLQEKSSLFGNASLYLLSAVTLLYTACEFGIWNWLPKYLIAMGMPSARALTILSLGFASGLLLGRVAATPILMRVSPLALTVSCSVAMAVFTYLILQPMPIWVVSTMVFLAGMAMAPVFPTTVAMIGKIFCSRSATAIGFAITCGFSGLILSSPVIGWLSGPDPKGIGRGLMLLPCCSIAICMILISSRKVFNREEGQHAAVASVVAGGL